MKLCLIAPSAPPYGGVANWEKIIRNEIMKHSEINLKQINISPNKRSLDGRNIFDRVFYSSYVMLRAFFQLKKEVRENRPDVIHMTTSGGLGFFRDFLLLSYAKKKKISSVYHVHFGRASQWEKKQSWQWECLLVAMRLASSVIVIDKRTLQLTQKYIESTKIHYIPNPIENKFFKMIEVHETSAIVYLGWVIKEKGIEELLNAFAMLKSRNKDNVILKIIGPVQEKYLHYLAGKYSLKDVEIIGELDHKEAILELSKAKIFVLPSYTEGFPNVILEAMALGKAIVAANVGAIPDMLSDDSGVVIPHHDSLSIVNAIDELLKKGDMREKLGKNARDRINEYYDVEKVFNQYYLLWRKTIAKS